MAKRSREKADPTTGAVNADAWPKQPFLVEKDAVDPSLALLFASSVAHPLSDSELWAFAKARIGWTCETAIENSL